VWRRARPCESHTHESYDPDDPDDPCDSYKSYEPCDLNESDESPAVDREGVFHEVVYLRRRGTALAW
jgi:hypothetical protein